MTPPHTPGFEIALALFVSKISQRLYRLSHLIAYVITEQLFRIVNMFLSRAYATARLFGCLTRFDLSNCTRASAPYDLWFRGSYERSHVPFGWSGRGKPMASDKASPQAACLVRDRPGSVDWVHAVQGLLFSALEHAPLRNRLDGTRVLAVFFARDRRR